MDKTTKIRALSCIICVGFIVALVFHYIMGAYFHLPVPYNTFTSVPRLEPFTDFTGLINYLKKSAPFAHPNIWVNYFPLAYIFLSPFTLIKNELISYSIYFSTFLFFWIYINVKVLRCKNLSKLENFQNMFFLVFLSYPFIILFDSGNFDMMIFLFISAFIYFFKSKKFLISAIFIALANAIKPFTWIFLIIFLFEKKYKELILSIILSILLIFGGFMVLKDGFFTQVKVLLINLNLTKKFYIYSTDGGLSGNSSSLFMSLKTLNDLFKPHFYVKIPVLINICKYIGLIVTSSSIFFAWKEKVFWKKVALLTFCMLTLSFMIRLPRRAY